MLSLLPRIISFLHKKRRESSFLFLKINVLIFFNLVTIFSIFIKKMKNSLFLEKFKLFLILQKMEVFHYNLKTPHTI